MLRCRFAVLSALPLLALTACDPSAPKAPPLPPLSKAAPLDTADAAFVQQLNEADVVVIALGKLAATNAARNDVHALADTLVKDHTANREALGKIVSPHDVTLTDAPMNEAKEEIEALSKLHGGRFDTAYIAFLRREHSELAEALARELARSGNGDLKALATDTQKMMATHEAAINAVMPAARARRHRR